MAVRIVFDENRLAEICREHHILKLSFFGSVLGEEFGDDSDIDILVEFEPGHVPGYGIIGIQDELSQLFGGRSVDLLTVKSINHRIRERVIRSAEVQYAAEG